MTNEETKDAGQLMVELARLRTENAKLREFAEELAYADVCKIGKYELVIQVDFEIKAAARAFFQAEKEAE